jgi:serine/threonine protein kinase
MNTPFFGRHHRLCCNCQRSPNGAVLCRKSILSDTPSFSRTCWESISSEAIDFIKQCLTRDHKARPSAAQALEHPWLASDAAHGNAPLATNVVARMQHFAHRYVTCLLLLPCGTIATGHDQLHCNRCQKDFFSASFSLFEAQASAVH